MWLALIFTPQLKGSLYLGQLEEVFGPSLAMPLTSYSQLVTWQAEWSGSVGWIWPTGLMFVTLVLGYFC